MWPSSTKAQSVQPAENSHFRFLAATMWSFFSQPAVDWMAT